MRFGCLRLRPRLLRRQIRRFTSGSHYEALHPKGSCLFGLSVWADRLPDWQARDDVILLITGEPVHVERHNLEDKHIVYSLEAPLTNYARRLSRGDEVMF